MVVLLGVVVQCRLSPRNPRLVLPATRDSVAEVQRIILSLPLTWVRRSRLQQFVGLLASIERTSPCPRVGSLISSVLLSGMIALLFLLLVIRTSPRTLLPTRSPLSARLCRYLFARWPEARSSSIYSGFYSGIRSTIGVKHFLILSIWASVSS